MSGKQVRFANYATMFSPPNSRRNTISQQPPTTYNPSPSSSSNSSLPVQQPPVIPHMPRSQYQCHAPTPSYTNQHMHSSSSYHHRSHTLARLHWVLEYSSNPMIVFDLRLHTDYIYPKVNNIPSSVYYEPATQPPTSYMCIRSKHLRWTTVVSPTGYSRSSKSEYITVGDVLKALYHDFRRNIDEKVYWSLDGRDKEKTNEAYKRRYAKFRDTNMYDEERRGGIRRVDLLHRNNKFLGITPYDNSGRGEWLLHTGH